MRKKKKDAATAALTPEALSAAARLAAEKDFLDGLQRLLDFFKIKDRYEPPEQRRTVNDDILLAAKTRELMDSKCMNVICACCSRPRARGLLYTGHPVIDGGGQEGPEEEMGGEGRRDEEEEEEVGGGKRESPDSRRSMLSFHLSTIPNLDVLLRANGLKNEEFPRDAFTTYRGYCLQSEGIRHPDGKSEGHEMDDSIDPIVDLCYECRNDLKGNRVPKASLVRLDPGALPPGLRPLTIAEELLLALGRACRYVFVLKPSIGKGPSEIRYVGDPSVKQFCFKGHLIAFPNVSIEDVSACFPMPLADIPKHMQVRACFSVFPYFCKVK